MSTPFLISVIGPTASGKTAFAARLAYHLDGEVISADSRQVYRKMNIGTGKDYSDYIVEGSRVPYHLVDIVDAGYRYSLYEFQRDFKKAWEDIISRGRQAVLCGGSGMYLEAVTGAYQLVNVLHNKVLRSRLEPQSDEELAATLSSFGRLHNVSDTSSRKRLIRAIEIAEYTRKHTDVLSDFPEFRNLIFGIDVSREERRRRITERLESRLAEGLVDEVRELLDSGIIDEDLIFYGLEYKYLTLYVTGRMGYTEMKMKLNTAIHQFAKRQMTWFRRMERNGYMIHWLPSGIGAGEKIERALDIFNRNKGLIKKD